VKEVALVRTRTLSAPTHPLSACWASNDEEAAKTVTAWNNWTRLQPVQFEWEDEPQPSVVRLVSGSARVDDPDQASEGRAIEPRAFRMVSPLNGFETNAMQPPCSARSRIVCAPSAVVTMTGTSLR
jgi:hypothetical protein